MISKLPYGVAKAAISTLRLLAGVVIVADAAARPLYRPIVDAIARSRAIAAAETFVAALPRPAILALFAIPFLIAEPLKIFALVMIASGSVIPGIVLLVFSYLVTFLLVERVYHAGRDKLRSYGWFDWGIIQAQHVKDAIKSFGKETALAFWRAVGRSFG